MFVLPNFGPIEAMEFTIDHHTSWDLIDQLPIDLEYPLEPLFHTLPKLTNKQSSGGA
jgi:hypothetical protein